MTPLEFAAKIEWEGGIFDAFLDYGLTADDLDDTDPALKSAVRAFMYAMARVQPELTALEEALSEYGE